MVDVGGGMRVAGFTDGPDGCISKCFPTSGTGILKSDLDVAVSVSMALCKIGLVVEGQKAKRSIQHCRDTANPLEETRPAPLSITTRAVQGPPIDVRTVYPARLPRDPA
jgi:hypothetical protein